MTVPVSCFNCCVINSDNSPNSILNALKKLTFLKEHNVPSWDLSCLNPNRIKFLAQLGKKSSNHALKKTNEEKRYPILVAFVYQIFEEVTDETMDLYIHCLGDIDARAKRDLKEFHLREAKSTNEKVRLLKELGQIIPDDAPQDFITPKWKNYIFDEKGNIVRRYYEMSVLWELRRALRSGDVWLEHSRRYANPESYLIPKEKWSSLLREVCQMLQLPFEGKERLQQQQEALDHQLEKLHQTIKDNDKVRILLIYW